MTNTAYKIGVPPDEPQCIRSFAARALVRLEDPDNVISPLCEHMVEHGATVERSGEVYILRFLNAVATFSNERDMTLIEVSAKDIEGLYFLRLSVASHVLEFSPEGLKIEWVGDGGTLVHPPNFQRLEVLKIYDVTPHMRRITFSAEDALQFASLEALHLNLILQHPDALEPQWPTVGSNGLIAWNGTDRRPSLRKYTVRSVDVENGTLDIDFVLHADAGPGSNFAVLAKRGDLIGVLGPGGGGLVNADWYLFAGDETALPAIARMLENLASTATGKVIIEVATESEFQDLSYSANLHVEWLFRDRCARGESPTLAEAVSKTDIPSDGSRLYVWVGCEFRYAQTIRKQLRSDLRISKKEHLVVSYWRAGQAEEE